MAWKVRFRPSVEKDLKKLSREARERVISFLESLPNDPRMKGKTMTADKGEPPMWRYRIGDYRVVCHLRDSDRVILVLRVGHRKDVYR